MRFEHPAPFGARWPARWIWFEPPAIHLATATRPVLAEPRDRIGLLRRTLTLDVVPDHAPCRIWADARLHLRVNGVEVAHGPVRSDPRRGRYDVVDLAPHLVTGTNVLAVVARHFGQATSWWMPVPPTYALGSGSFLLEAHIGDEVVVSDAAWNAFATPAWTAVAMPGDVACLPIESFDARLHPWGWDRADFDDGAWGPAIEQVPFHTGAHGDPRPPSEPYGMLRPPVREAFPSGAIHQAEPVGWRTVRGSAAIEDPVAQVLADEHQPAIDEGGAPVGGAVRIGGFDLGRIAAGRVRLVVEGAAPGTVIDVAAAEHVAQDADWRDDAGPAPLVPLGQHAGFRYVCAGGEREEFETLESIGTRHLRAAVRHRADPAPDPAVRWPEVHLSIADRHRPRPAGASFACSDPLLERIHEVGLRTVDLCALDAYVDCPTREQRAWTGDSVVHQMVDLVANPDWSMARWHPQLAASPRSDGMLAMAPASDFEADDRTFVPDWSLHWIRAVHNLYRYTGDRALIAELLPVAERTLRWFEAYLGDDALLHDVSGWALLDWAAVYSQGTSSVLNALWARGLEDVAEMAGWLDNAGTATWARRRYEGVRVGFERFWDEGRGTYVDHLVGGVARRAAAQHPSAAALAAGLVPAERIERVVARMTDPSRLVRRSFAMDSVTPEGGGIEFLCLVTGYPEPDWDVEDQVVAAEPFFRYVVHDGLARAGRADLIAQQCRDWSVFLDAGETTWPECWNGGTRCHGWSSTPTRDLIVHVLGIQPAEPGYGSVVVRPALGDLEWARATVPTPHGPITVEARADGTIEVDSPVPVVS
jgi:hypothetical protein